MQILIDCRELSRRSDQVTLLTCELEEKRRGIQAIIEALGEVWKGSSERQLHMQLTEQLQKEAAMEEQLMTIASLMKSAAEIWQDSDEKWASEIESL